MKITSTVSEIVIEWEKERFQATSESMDALKSTLASVKEIDSIKLTGKKKKRIVIVYRSPKGVVEFLRLVTSTIRSTQNTVDDHQANVVKFERKPAASADRSARPAIGFLARWSYGGLAIGSFVMAWVGLIVPGIPTIPFVILTVYFAEKFSPTLRNRLLESPVIGTAMRDWSEHQAIRRSVRDRVFLFVGVMVVLSIMFTSVDSIMFLFVIFFAIMSVYMIQLVPVIEDADAQREAGLIVA